MKKLPKPFNAVIVDSDGVFMAEIPKNQTPEYDRTTEVFRNLTTVEDLSNYDEDWATKLFINADNGYLQYI